MRLVTTLFLSLFFLLLKAEGHVYAGACPNPLRYAVAQLSEKSGPATFKNSQTVIYEADSTDTDSEAINAAEPEDDDDDLTSCRKSVEITNYALTLFYNTVAGNLSQYCKNRLPVCKHFSYTASSKYIVQRVIRI